MPEVKFDLSTYGGYNAAETMVAQMVASVVFRERHEWLLKRGWTFLGFYGAHHAYGCPRENRYRYLAIGDASDADLECTCGAKPQRRYEHTKLGVCNQTRAINLAAWDILERKGMLVKGRK